MVQRIQKARSRPEFEREERLASESLGGGGNKKDLGTNVGGVGTQKNTARGVETIEAEDYDEDDMRMLGGTKETGETEAIQAGTYEEDYGSGVQGRRSEGQTGAASRKPSLPRKEKTISGQSEDHEDFPTGKWSRQKVRAKLSGAPGNAKATKGSSRRPEKARAPQEGGNRGRRSGETGAFRGRNAGGNRPRHTGLGGKTAAPKSPGTAARTGRTPKRSPGSQALSGARKNASSPATARKKTIRNEGD